MLFNKIHVVTLNGLSIKAYVLPIIKDVLKSFGFNLILFFPMGILLPMLKNKFFTFGKVLLISALSSICIEILQLITMLISATNSRCFDVDDIIANTLGGLIGFLIRYLLTVNR
jgi:Glycopeptide antibiotics resistance protein